MLLSCLEIFRKGLGIPVTLKQASTLKSNFLRRIVDDFEILGRAAYVPKLDFITTKQQEICNL